jgi:predicted GH43/DUF377 family glycosyl hydrolase
VPDHSLNRRYPEMATCRSPERRRLLSLVTAALLLTTVLGQVAASQTRWARHPDNPVLRVILDDSRDPFAYRHKYAPSVIMNPSGARFKMWFANTTPWDGRWSISHALSPDGVTWYLYDRNNVFSTSSNPNFDDEWVIDPDVIVVGDEYYMYYAGHDGVRWKGGLATSSDGIRWTRSDKNPLFETVAGTWESVVSGAQRTVVRDNVFYAFYAGYDGTTRRMGLANSTDGETWTKFPGNPVLGPGASGEWDELGVTPLTVYIYRGVFHLLYNSEPVGAIGLATSENGVLWKKYAGNPVFSPGPAGTWDSSMAGATAVLDGDSVRLWYAGYGPAGLGGYSAWQIGYAVSPLDTTVLSASEGTAAPGQFSLLENYPNPFNASTVISFDLPRRAAVRVTVYDIVGKEVATLAKDVYDQGRHAVTFDASSQASGVYYCTAEARYEDAPGQGAMRSTRAMVLVK